MNDKTAVSFGEPGWLGDAPPPLDTPGISSSGRWLILAAAFFGWFFAGTVLSTTSQAMRSAAIDLLAKVGDIDLERFDALNKTLPQRKGPPDANAPLSLEEVQLKAWNALAQEWFAYFTCGMLFGAATGGFVFGRLGDRVGRSPAMAASILCFSLLALAAYFAQTPVQLLVLWFLASLGVGGMWPNGVALLAETWSNLSRPLVAGLMGTSANIGIFALATVATQVKVTPDQWRWMLLIVAAPAILGLLVLFFVPESPRWLAAQREQTTAGAPVAPRAEVFRPPLLWITLVGILLATVPLIGGWGSANWMIPWAGEAAEKAQPPNPYLQAQVGQARALTGLVGSMLGGWIGHLLGRRFSYFLVSLLALFCAEYTYLFLEPTDATFLYWVAALGFFSGIFFGWLPLFLPELFPTRARSTGSGVSFNSGRILTAVTVFASGALTVYFGQNYPGIGRITSLIYAIGMVAIWLAPDTTRRQLQD